MKQQRKFAIIGEDLAEEKEKSETNQSAPRGVTFIQVQPMDTIEETSSVTEIEDESDETKEIPNLSQRSDMDEDHQMKKQEAENNPEEEKSEGLDGSETGMGKAFRFPRNSVFHFSFSAEKFRKKITERKI